MRKRRYEILLPLAFNDGTPVPDETFAQTKEDLVARFDGISVTPQSVLGVWKRDGHTIVDQLARWLVDVDDCEENEFFFSNWKTVLIERFQQLEIYIVSYPIDRV